MTAAISNDFYPAPDLVHFGLRLFTPPPTLSLWRFADRYLTVSRERNPAEYGKWRTDRVPWLKGVMEAFRSGQYKIAVCMKSARMGFTSVIENDIAYAIELAPTNILLLQPTDDDAEMWSKDHWAPMVRDNDFLQEKFAGGSRIADETLLHKKFPGGLLNIKGATSARVFRRANYVRAYMDEGDAMVATQEGDQWALLLKRIFVTNWNGFAALISTPTFAGTSRVAREYGYSNQSHYYVPCPHCGFMQVLFFSEHSMFAQPDDGGIIGNLAHNTDKGWSRLRFDKEEFDRTGQCTWAVYVCGGCGKDIEEKHKHALVQAGEWRPANPHVTDIAGFHINELYSTFYRTWAMIATDFLKAKRDPETFKVFINQTLGETYRPRDEMSLSEMELLNRREDYYDEKDGFILPAGVMVLVASVDVQADRLEILVRGYGKNWESWMIEHHIIIGDPTAAALYEALDGYLYKQFKHASGVTLGIATCFIDARTPMDNILQYTTGKAHRRIWGIVGNPGAGPLLGKPKQGGKYKRIYIPLQVWDGTKRIYARLKQPKGMPGYMHFNKQANLEYFLQLTSKVKRRKFFKGRLEEVWENKPGRQQDEAHDIEVYNLAAVENMNINWEKYEKNFAAMVEHAKQQPGEPPKPEPSGPPHRRTTKPKRNDWRMF